MKHIMCLLAAAAAAVLSAAPAVAHADPGSSCDERWEACNSPVWCETTGQYLPRFSGYCPIGPDNYPPPRLGR
jgi:hypothetical protein